ncbi:MAG TPA: integration host factor subunit alpha [Alphaproteobacteria bacterium]|nr:integration host factor subunit alpha [Alphaproteobacteria bacterium]
MTSLTRADIAGEVQKKLGFSFSESTSIVDMLVEELCAALEKNDSLKVTSFGTFSVRHKKPRISRNPKTKVEAVISGRKVVSFYSSNLLDEELNS